MQFLVLAEQILFRPFAVSNFPDRLNCTDNRALCITERGGDEPERGPFPIIEVGDSDLRDEVLLVPDQILVFYYGRRVIPEDEIDQEGTALTVKGKSIFVVAFSKNLICPDTGHLLHRFIPCDHYPMGINSKGCVRQEVDDIGLSPREDP